MRAFRFSLVALVLGAMALGLWINDRDPAPDTRYLLNRLWVERVPKTERDQVHYFVAIEESERVGTVALASQWRVHADNFRFKLKGKQLDLDFPQERKLASFQAKTEKCSAPQPFTLCLDLVGKDGRRVRFYSREDWNLDDKEALPLWAPPMAPSAAAGAEEDECVDCAEGWPALLP